MSMDPQTEAKRSVVAYLNQQKARLGIMTVDYIVYDVRRFGPNVSILSDADLRITVALWRSINGPIGALPAPPARTPEENKMVAAVKKAFSVAFDGVDLHYRLGKVNLSVTGPTAEFQKVDARLAVGVSWTGTLGLEAQAGNFHLTGELSKEKWGLTLSYPDDNIIPDLSKVSQVFADGEKAVREALVATSSFNSLDDVARIKAAVEPHFKPAKDALDAAKGIAKATRRANVGVTLGSPDPLPGQKDMPKGIQGQVTVTIRF
jgi:hypothetical protein